MCFLIYPYLILFNMQSGYCYLLALAHQLSGHVACEFHYLGILLYWIWKTGWEDPFQ
ncbi:hypothetical protein Hanom_Chr12g01079041 [Helianthus anomalus]